MDACVRNKDKALALKTYRQALDAGLVDSQHIYTSSIAACIPDKDIHTALSIFHEMLRYIWLAAIIPEAETRLRQLILSKLVLLLGPTLYGESQKRLSFIQQE